MSLSTAAAVPVPEQRQPQSGELANLHQILQRRRPLPQLKSVTRGTDLSSEQLLQLALEVNEVLRVEFTEKQSLAMEVIEKCQRLLREEHRNQLADLERTTAEKDALMRIIHQSRSKFDQIQSKQNSLSDRVDAVLRGLQELQPPLSEEEAKMRRQLEGAKQHCLQYSRSLQELQARQEFQRESRSVDWPLHSSPTGASSSIPAEGVRSLEQALRTQ